MRRFLVGGLATVLLALISFTFITSLHAQPPGGPPGGCAWSAVMNVRLVIASNAVASPPTRNLRMTPP